MNLLKPDGSARVAEKQAMQKKHHDSKAAQRERCYQAGDAVMAHNYRHGPKWLPVTVAEAKGPLSYIIQLKSGLIWRRHISQLRDGIRKQSPMVVPVSARTHPVDTPQTHLDDTAHTQLDDTAYTPSDIGTHVPLDDTVNGDTPSNHAGEPVVVSRPVSNATGSPPSTAEISRYPQWTCCAPDKYIEHY